MRAVAFLDKLSCFLFHLHIFFPFLLPSSSLSITLPCTGRITPENEAVFEQGNDIVLQCNLDVDEDSTQFAGDVKWYKSSSLIPEGMYREIGHNVSELRVINATMDDSGNYYCGFEGDSLQDMPGIVVIVGRKHIISINIVVLCRLIANACSASA